MSRTFVVVIALALLGPALTGCLGIGGGDDGNSGGLEGTESKAQVSSSTGGIEGVVTDSAIQAVEGVTVTVEELGESTTTTTDGSFAFSDLTPGSYTLSFAKEGFISAERSVDVVANDVTTLELVMAHEPSVEPFMQQFKFEGFLECSGSFSSPAPIPDQSPVFPGTSGLSAAACSIPNTATTGNATNDRFIFYHPIEPNPWQVVGELDWEPSNDFASRMAVIVEPGGLPNDGKTEYGEARGGPPQVLSADRATIAGIVENTTAVCEGEKSPESTISAPADSYCNRNPIEDGGQIQLRVFVQPYEPAGNGAGAGTAIQQSFTVFNTVFYNAPACEDYSITQENLCPQQESPPEEDPYDGPVGNTSNGSDGDGSR